MFKKTDFISRYFIVSLLLLSCIPAFSQEDRIDSLLNDIIYTDNTLFPVAQTQAKYDYVFVGSNFNNNTYYAGREIGSDMYNISGYLFYFNSAGFYFGTSGVWFDQLIPQYNSTTLTAGYSLSLDKKKNFNLKTSYSRYIYNLSDTSATYPYENNFSLGFYYRKNWFRARVNSNVLFGEETILNFSPAIYSRFNLIKLGKKNKIYTTPELSFFIGNEEIVTVNDTKNVFGLLNTQLYVPLYLSLGDFDLEFSYTFNFPTTQDKNTSYAPNSMFSFSIGYLLPIAKKQKSSK